MTLNPTSPYPEGDRYLLDTLLSTLGLPYCWWGDPAEAAFPPGRCVRLELGPEHQSSLDSAFFLLVRGAEYQERGRDQHGRFLWTEHRGDQEKETPEPLVSQLALWLLEAMREAFAARYLPMLRKEIWPHARPMAACLTHDLDVVRRGKLPRGVALRDVTGLLGSAARGRLRQAASLAAGIAATAISDRDPYWTFNQIASLEQEHGYRSTYFAMASHLHSEDATYDLAEPEMAGLLRSLAESGCEVALHGSYATSTDGEALRAQREKLETRLGQPVRGHRNHLLRFQLPDSWRAHQTAGFAYDATLGYADHEGFRAGHAFPFHPYDPGTGQAMNLLEIPLAIMDVSLSKYRKLRGEEAWQAIELVLEQTRSVQGLATLLWHNDTFYEPEHPGSAELYRRALAWLAKERAYVAPAWEIDRWWRAREAVSLSPLPDDAGWRMEVPEEIEGLVLRANLADSSAYPRISGAPAVALTRDGADLLLQFDHLPAGASVQIEVHRSDE